MNKYTTNKGESEILPNLLGLKSTEDMTMSEFEGFLYGELFQYFDKYVLAAQMAANKEYSCMEEITRMTFEDGAELSHKQTKLFPLKYESLQP